MEFFQEPTFTAFLAVVLTFILAKIVSFAVSTDHDNSAVCSIDEGPVAKEVTLNRGSRVISAKDEKKVRFVDDVEKIVDQFEENKDLGEKITEGFDMGQEEGSDEKVEKETDDGDNMDGGFSENHKTSGTSVLKSEISDEGDEIEVEKEGNVESDDDWEWEGIERSELERVFAEAVNYLEYGGGNGNKDKENVNNNNKLSSDVEMELYGLHKVAVEGPCHEPQPMALKVSARAKWNAWQKLGSMSQDAAMEHYIRVLADNIPDWMHDYSADNDIQGSPKLETIGKISDDPGFERKSELGDTPVGGDSSNGQSCVGKDDTV